jgi:exodeoxyribonuclease VIII
LNNDSGHQIKETTSEQLYTHLMVDLESMGDNPDAPIVSIGAVFFDPETGRTGAEFYKVISLASAMAFGSLPDAGKILWWMRKSSEARSALLVEDAIPLDDALLQFNDFIGENAANGPDTVQVWGNGATFDNVLLSQSYKRAGITRPWKFRNDRDVRTIVELGKAVGINPRNEIPFEGELHNALDDARHQVKYVSKIWQVLTQI